MAKVAIMGYGTVGSGVLMGILERLLSWHIAWVE